MGEKKLPVLSIENMVVVAAKYIQIDNKFNFSNQHKFSHLHFYETTFITKQNYNMEYESFFVLHFMVQNMPVYYSELY